jgi:phosphate acetyltransferase
VSFLADLAARAPASLRIAFPESTDSRIAAAIVRLAESGGPRPVAVTDGVRTPAHVDRLDLADQSIREEVSSACPDLGEEGSGDTLRLAVSALACGLVDGVVAGAVFTTADVLRAGLRILGPAKGIKTVSAAFYMVTPPLAGGPERVLTFTDSAVVPHPDAGQLAEIADAACRARREIVGDEPRVAFLYYSTHGSADGPGVDRIREAIELFRERQPTVPVDGELQADVALSTEVSRRKAPGSPVGGKANILVFPDLASGNIGYKLVQRLAGARAVGPIIQGLSMPVNDLSRGASIEDIVDVTHVTALQAAGSASRNQMEIE